MAIEDEALQEVGGEHQEVVTVDVADRAAEEPREADEAAGLARRAGRK